MFISTAMKERCYTASNKVPLPAYCWRMLTELAPNVEAKEADIDLFRRQKNIFIFHDESTTMGYSWKSSYSPKKRHNGVRFRFCTWTRRRQSMMQLRWMIQTLQWERERIWRITWRISIPNQIAIIMMAFDEDSLNVNRMNGDERWFCTLHA